MSKNQGRIFRGVLISGPVALVAGLLVMAVFTKGSRPLAMPLQAAPLSVFCAPSSVPAGEHWVLVGSLEELPADLVATAATGGVAVVELQTISKKATAVRMQVASGAQGRLLHLSSASTQTEAYPDLFQGPMPESRTADANIKDEDFLNGTLVVDGKYLIYGYNEAGDTALAALRIHNRSTGIWHCHEHAIAKTRDANEVKTPVPPYFMEVNELETLPDTDGNGVPDFADVEETRPVAPEQLGVELVPETNVLDLVAVDESGVTSWRTLNVFTSFKPAE